MQLLSKHTLTLTLYSSLAGQSMFDVPIYFTFLPTPHMFQTCTKSGVYNIHVYYECACCKKAYCSLKLTYQSIIYYSVFYAASSRTNEC